MRPVSLIIFDLDGTLVDTLEDIAASVNHALARLEMKPIPVAAVRNYIGDGIEQLMLRSLGGQGGRLVEAVNLYKDHHRQHFAVRSALYPGVRETLEYYRSAGMAVISNKSQEFIHPLLRSLGIHGYFTRVIGADSGMPLKPAPDAVVNIMGSCGAPKERTVIVGDGTADIRAGKAAGIITCSVTYGFRSEEELRREGPDHVISALTEMKRLFSPDRGRTPSAAGGPAIAVFPRGNA